MTTNDCMKALRRRLSELHVPTEGVTIRHHPLPGETISVVIHDEEISLPMVQRATEAICRGDRVLRVGYDPASYHAVEGWFRLVVRLAMSSSMDGMPARILGTHHMLEGDGPWSLWRPTWERPTDCRIKGVQIGEVFHVERLDAPKFSTAEGISYQVAIDRMEDEMRACDADAGPLGGLNLVPAPELPPCDRCGARPGSRVSICIVSGLPHEIDPGAAAVLKRAEEEA